VPAVELNIDLGELPGEPAELYALATVVNIACGGHAGDVASMARALSFALARGARVAAHPSYPDRAGFGRVSLALSPEALRESVEEQCAALAKIARRLAYPVAAVKPHGALYHDAARDPALAAAVVEGALRGLSASAVTVVGPPAGALADEARSRGLAYAREGFADRAYRPDGSLVPRTEAGALLTQVQACVRQAIALASSGRVETLCLHGDTPGALDLARAVRGALEQAGLLAGAA
jgi:5-oxoprolinase (ATP-hydrolysing) subunit A